MDEFEDSQSGEDDNVRENVGGKGPFFSYNPKEDVATLTSPTFGDQIRIKSPSVKFGSSRNALKDLKHVEEQIKDFSILPDFGYAEDNYILSQYLSTDPQRILTGLLGDPKRFAWLMNYINLTKL